MKNQLLRDLIAFGLSEKEARIYLALLELGTATANQTAEKAEVNRSSTYVVLNSLKTKGMVGCVEKSTVQEFFAISPETLIQTAESSLHTVEEKLERIKSILPELKGMITELPYRPKVRVFEGKNGLVQAMSETLTTQEKIIRAFTSLENMLSLMSEEFKIWVMHRITHKIQAKVIYVDNELAHAFNSPEFLGSLGSPSQLFLLAVYLPKENYPFPIDAIIWDDKVGYLIVEGDQVTTIILEAKEIGLVMKNMFDMAFEQAKLNGTYEET